MDYSIGYVGKIKSTHGDSFEYWMDRLQSDFYIINESAKMMGIKSGDAIIKILKENNIAIRTTSENTTINNLRRSNNGKYKKP